MIIPIRCFSCNNPISRFYLEYVEHKKHKTPLEFFEEKKIEKYCCRRMLLTQVDTYKIISKEQEPSK